MPISKRELNRDFIVVNEWTTVREVRDQVAATGNNQVFIIVRLDNGQYAVLRLSELIQVLQKHSDVLLPEMLEAPLSYVPALLAPRAGDAVEQASVGTGVARRLATKTPGRRLVVLADGQVVGLLTKEIRKAPTDVDLDWLNQPLPDIEVHEAARPTPPV